MSHKSSPAAGVGRQTFLVVFDFDHTLIDANTDTEIPQHLGKGEVQNELIKGRAAYQKAHKDAPFGVPGPERKTFEFQWTNMMNELLRGYTPEELTRAAHESIHFSQPIKELFQLLVKLQNTRDGALDGGADASQQSAIQEAPFLEIVIASDANSLFIDSILTHEVPFAVSGIRHIHSNPLYDLSNPTDAKAYPKEAAAGDKIHIEWYEKDGHPCQLCNERGKLNICKTRIIQRALQRTKLIDPTIIYVGDGENDYCPCVNLLRPRDYMFPRREFPIHKELSRARAPNGEKLYGAGCCKYKLWRSHEDLLALFRSVLQSKAVRLPTLVRFRDASAKEFRSITLLQRMPSIVQRTLEANAKGPAPPSAAAAAFAHKLAESIRNNDVVPSLPGETTLPNWLHNYAWVEEFDDATNACATGAASKGCQPRWGQLPWLAGEIYSYHVLWQYMLIAENDEEKANRTPESTRELIEKHLSDCVLNVATPYAAMFPVIHQASALTPNVGGHVNPHTYATAHINVGTSISGQEMNAAFLATTPADLDEVSRIAQEASGERAMSSGPKRIYQSALPTNYFVPYHDIFTHEKTEVVVGFIAKKIAPMVRCLPWKDTAMLPVLIRWMLWGNGVDLSMFTLDQLHGGSDAKDSKGDATSAGGADGASGNGSGEASVEAQRAAFIQHERAQERKAVLAQDDHVVGNNVDAVAQYIDHLIRTPHAKTASSNDGQPAGKNVDIVMDNVGVEQVADLLFALWVLENDPDGMSIVTFHVKPMPYYVSDTTPRDFEILLSHIEKYLAETPTETNSPIGDLTKIHLEEFVNRIREGFTVTKRLRVEADPVWTLPSEVRELPPYLVNTYFYQQRVKDEATLKAAEADVSKTLEEEWLINKEIRPISNFVFFKGDLNFRRIMGDRHWDRKDFVSTIDPKSLGSEAPAYLQNLFLDTQAKSASDGAPTFREVMSAYWPVRHVPVCAIRTIKSECCVGTPRATQEKLDVQDPKWRTSGQYGLILFAGPQ